MPSVSVLRHIVTHFISWMGHERDAKHTNQMLSIATNLRLFIGIQKDVNEKFQIFNWDKSVKQHHQILYTIKTFFFLTAYIATVLKYFNPVQKI